MIDIFIPVYNEGKNIERLFRSLQQEIREEFEVLIVYDSEEDDTLPVIHRIKENYPFKVRLVKNIYGKGALNAYRTGVKMAEHEYWVFTMADCSDSLASVNEMYRKMQEGYDVVCGSRYMKGGKVQSNSKLKSLLSKWAGIIMHFILKIPTHDISNGFKMYRTKIIQEIEIESTKGFEVILEHIIKAYLRGYKITEVPASWTDRTEGTSNFKMLDWIPQYLEWCFYGLKNRWFTKRRL